MKIYRKSLIYMTILFIIMACIFFILGTIGIISGRSGDLTTYFFYGTIICLLFALVFKPKNII